MPVVARLFLVLLFTMIATPAVAQTNWPQFRGAQSAGVAEGAALPVEWDAGSGAGVKWRAEAPGLGLSSPVIWGDKLFLTTAVSDSDGAGFRTGLYGDIGSVADDSEHVWKVLAFDKNSGELLWETEAHRGKPAVKRHEKSSHANATVATDGEKLVAFFGSEGLYCLDLDGGILWKKDFGVLDAGYFQVPEAQWEFGNSPVIHDGKLVVLADVQGGGFLTLLSLEDGREIWRTPRGDVPTWGAPLVVETGARTQIVVNGWKHAGGYDFETGEELWRVDGGGDFPVPTPIYGEGRFYLTSAHGPMAPVYAVPEGMRGTVELGEYDSEELAWRAKRQGAYMATPLLYDGLLYVVRWNGILVAMRPESGEVVYRKRLAPGAYTASPAAGDGKIYITDEEGGVTVIRAGEDYERLARNKLGEATLASPAISDGVIFFRTERSLIAVAAPR